MSDMRRNMLKRLAKQHASKLERSKSPLEDERRRARHGDASRRADLGQLCEWASRARHEVPPLNGEFQFIAAFTPEATEAPKRE